MKKEMKLIGTGLVTALASSLCCITPILALISGTSGIASTFSWIEPLRPYLVIFTMLVLGFAWYQKLKPKDEINCNCENNDLKEPFLQSKLFLTIVTMFAFLMTIFPYYSSTFYPTKSINNIVIAKENVNQYSANINGMTCSSCEEHINFSINQLNGIRSIKTSYENGNSIIEFDNSKTSIEDIRKAINSTGYNVIPTKNN